MGKVVMNSTPVPYITIDATSAAPAPVHRAPIGLQAFVPAILQRILPALPDPRRPLSTETVQRVLTRVIRSAQACHRQTFDVWAPKIITWGILPDGTTVAIIEDNVTGIRHMWSLHNETFEPVSYGMVDA